MAERAVLRRENGGGRVIAHRGQRLLAILGHGREDRLDLLDGVAGRDLTAAQFRPGKERLFRHARQHLVKLVDLAHPFAKGLGMGQLVLDFRVVIEAPLLGVHGQHLTGAKRALFPDARLIDRHHPGLGPGDHQPVAGDHIAHRAQPVAIEPGTDPAAVGHGECGRPVPWLHHRVAIGIHVAPCLGQFLGLF